MIKFVYFDVGRVIIDFDHPKGARQIAEACGVSFEDIWKLLFTSGLSMNYEKGLVSTPELFAAIKGISKKPITPEQILFAAADIFTLKPDVVAIIEELKHRNVGLGILSNTSDAHWRFCEKHFNFIDLFSTLVLSYKVKALKPEPEIYKIALEKAGVKPEECFFTDDMPENVAGAKALGIRAFLFNGASQLRKDLDSVGV